MKVKVSRDGGWYKVEDLDGGTTCIVVLDGENQTVLYDELYDTLLCYERIKSRLKGVK